MTAAAFLLLNVAAATAPGAKRCLMLLLHLCVQLMLT